MIEKETLVTLIDQGLSPVKISVILGKGKTTVRYWATKYNLTFKTKNLVGCEHRSAAERNGKCKLCEAILAKKRYETKHKFVWQYLSEHSCVDCGNSNPVVLEFDHKDSTTKLFEIGTGISWGYSLVKIKKEITKCDVRCANCHKIRTALQFNYYSYLNIE